KLLSEAPMEFTDAARLGTSVITIPMPDGTFSRFRIERSPVLEPALAARVTEFQSFRGQGIDDPAHTARFDWGPGGFRATVLLPQEIVDVAPLTASGNDRYISFYRHDSASEQVRAECLLSDGLRRSVEEVTTRDSDVQPSATASVLRTYRLALG